MEGKDQKIAVVDAANETVNKVIITKTSSLRTDNIWGLYYVTLYSEFAQFDYIPPI